MSCPTGRGFLGLSTNAGDTYIFTCWVHKKQNSFLQPGDLNPAMSVYKKAKYQKSDFYLKNWQSAEKGIDSGIL